MYEIMPDAFVGISILAPTRGATFTAFIFAKGQGQFQSSLPRGERRFALEVICRTEHISILAPTRGATLNVLVAVWLNAISILAPTRGATQCLLVQLVDVRISILAPTRGATPIPDTGRAFLIFQSSLPRGERQQFSPKSSLFSQQKLSKIFNLNNKLF